jgi:hypothetical protein
MLARTIAEWGKLLEEKAKESHDRIGRSCFCGAELKAESIQFYPHDGGEEVDGMQERMWLYLVCPKCGHEWSHSHLLRG